MIGRRRNGRSGRLGLLALGALLLAGCSNMVESERPWFSEADARGAVQLKPGRWAADCPPAKDPRCADLKLDVTDRELRQPPPAQNLPASVAKQLAVLDKVQVTYLIAKSDPVVVQVRMRAPPEFQHEPGANLITYLGFRATQRDADGRVVAGEVWPVACGPQPQPGDANYEWEGELHSVTNRPLPGLRMDDRSCVAKDRAALVKAAAQTRTMDGAPLAIRWSGPTLAEKP